MKAIKETKRPMKLTTQLVNVYFKAVANHKAFQGTDYHFRFALKLQDIYAKLNPLKRNHQKLIENLLYHLEKVKDVVR